MSTGQIRGLAHVTGNLTFGPTETLDVSFYGVSMPPGGTYPLFAVDGTIGLLPTWTINLPPGWTSGPIVQSGKEVVLTDLQPVPEPSALALLAGGGLAWLGYASRRRAAWRTFRGAR